MSTKSNAPTILFIFGGSGDLANRKLIPAMYNLYLDDYLPEKIKIIGVDRAAFDNNEAYRKKLYESAEQFSRRKDELSLRWHNFANQVCYYELDLLEDSSYRKLEDIVREQSEAWHAEPIVIFYLAVAPHLAPVIAKKLSEEKLCNDPSCTRIVFEKPFGHDLQSAKELNQLLGGMLREEQIYRIDHYLGKETVQNILAFRFANAMFEPVWNNYYIDYIQITVAEAVGVGSRGAYYEQSGALRDMVQNHILQLLCMVAMEPPVSFDANEIRNKKLDVLNAMRIMSPAEVYANAVRGQYSEGELDGKETPAYRKEKNVNPESPVETFAAIKFFVDNWRWRDVPFYIRTGKCLREQASFITIKFKNAPSYSFPHESSKTWKPNRIIFRIQPEMDIRLRFQAKRPGPDMMLDPVDMIFSYTENYGEKEPEAYETLLEDVITGNQTLFMRGDQVESAWKVIMPILDSWQQHIPSDFPNYAPDTWGPEEAEELTGRDGHHWVTLVPSKAAGE